jgi:hypothetical protein
MTSGDGINAIPAFIWGMLVLPWQAFYFSENQIQLNME